MEPYNFKSDENENQDEDEEWEECQPGEEGCEEVEVDADGHVLFNLL